VTTTSDHDPGVRTGRRIGEVDALHGFALFGILIANFVAVTGILSIQDEAFDFTYTFDSPVDQAVSTVVDASFAGKFFVLFSSCSATRSPCSSTPPAPRPRPCRAVPCRACCAGAPRCLPSARCTPHCCGSAHPHPVRRTGPAAGRATQHHAPHRGHRRRLRPAGLSRRAVPGDTRRRLSFLDVQALGEGYRGGPLDTLTAQLSFALAFAAVIWFGQGPSALGRSVRALGPAAR